MKTRYTVVLSMIAGAALRGAVMQWVNAQMAGKKAYTVTELETLNPQAATDFAKRVSAAQMWVQEVVIFAPAAERLLAWRGRPTPAVAITEWDSLEKADAFFKSKAWTDLGPDRAKALKTIRRYAVEAVQ